MHTEEHIPDYSTLVKACVYRCRDRGQSIAMSVYCVRERDCIQNIDNC